jgi:hypothetical protein
VPESYPQSTWAACNFDLGRRGFFRACTVRFCHARRAKARLARAAIRLELMPPRCLHQTHNASPLAIRVETTLG